MTEANRSRSQVDENTNINIAKNSSGSGSQENQPKDDCHDEIFGPLSKLEFQNRKREEENTDDINQKANKDKKVKSKDNKKNEMVQINIYDMDRGIQNTDKKMVFIENKTGILQRDNDQERVEKIIERKM